MRAIVTFAAALTIAAMPAISKTSPDIEVTPLLGYHFGGSFETGRGKDKTEIELKEGTSYGLITAWSIDRKTQGEFLLSHYETDFSILNNFPARDTGLSVTYAHLGGNVPVSEGPVPVYVTGGLGLTHFNPDAEDLDRETRFSINVGLASKIPLSERISFRLDSRLYATFFNSDGAIFCSIDSCAMHVSSSLWVQAEVSAGITIKF